MYLGNTTVAGTLGIAGAVTATTQSAGDNSTKLATTGYVNAAVANAATIATTGGSTTLTAAQYGLPVLIVTGTLASPATLVVPNNGMWRVINRTNNAYPVVITTSAGAGFPVPNGNAGMDLVADGTNVVSRNTPAPRGYSVTPFVSGVPFFGSTGLNQGYASAATSATGGTGRQTFLAPYGMHDIRAQFANLYDPGAQSIPLFPVTFMAALEYPANTFQNLVISGKTPTFINANHQAAYTLAPWELVETLPVSIDIPGGAFAWVRTWVLVSVPPTVATPSTATSGGSLAAATYFYKITQLAGPQGESGPSTEVSVTTTGSTSANTLTWTAAANTVPATGWNVYRSTSTGTEVFLTTLPAGPMRWIDDGSLTPGAATPSAAQQFPQGPLIGGGMPSGWVESSNYGSGGDNGSNQTLASGTSTLTVTGQYGYGPINLLGVPDQGFNVPVVEFHGDSISVGAGSYDRQGWVAVACQNAGLAYFGDGRNGGSLGGYLNAPGSVSRGLFKSAVTDVICQYLTNDISLSLNTLAQAQVLLLQDAVSTVKRRKADGAPVRFWAPTILPRPQYSSDSYATAGNQFVQALPVTAATNASPIVVSFSSLHGATNGQQVTIAGVGGNTAANGTYFAGSVTSFTITLYSNAGLTTPVVGNGAYTSGGFMSRPWVDGNTRVPYNAWVMAGCPVASASNITAVAVGTSGALLAGQAGHPVYGVFDITANVEVNASNVLTTGGGRYIANGTANYACNDGIHPSATAVALITPTVPTALMLSP